jgi:L-ascorbate metabolism protein UlaG (beta-lactamase superfamily)
MTTTLDWYGCATFRLRTAGLTIFLDAYIDRVPGAAGTGLTADAIDACDWIIVGHSHFDHVWGAERIMQNTRARLVGSYETLRVMETAGVPVDRMIPVAGGETVDLGRGVRVSVFPSQHSCVWSQGQMAQADEVCVGDLGFTLQEQQERFARLVAHLTSLGGTTLEHLVASNQGARGDGGALVYLLETPGGSILYQDTSGHWTGILRDLRPDVAILAAAGRGNIDGQPIQGSLAQFVGRQAALVRSRRVMLCHHDNWLPGFSVATDIEPIRREITRVSPRTELLEVAYLAGTEIFGP